MSDSESLQILQSIDAKVSAMLAIQVHRTLLEDPDLAEPRPRSVDKLLHDAGLNQREIASLLGKSVQAVSQMIKRG